MITKLREYLKEGYSEKKVDKDLDFDTKSKEIQILKRRWKSLEESGIPANSILSEFILIQI